MARLRVVLPVCLVLAMTTAATQIRYPETRKTDQVDDYFGTHGRRSVPLARGRQQRRDRGLGRGAEQGHLRLPGEDPGPRAA